MVARGVERPRGELDEPEEVMGHDDHAGARLAPRAGERLGSSLPRLVEAPEVGVGERARTHELGAHPLLAPVDCSPVPPGRQCRCALEVALPDRELGEPCEERRQRCLVGSLGGSR